MRAIIMAGGFGTRLRPLTINLPKPLAPIVSRPIMEHVLALLVRHGITDVTAVLFYKADKIREYFGDGSKFGVAMDYIHPQEDLGTAGAVRAAAVDRKGPILVISGDLITDFDLTKSLTWHRENRSEATILLTRTENPLAYGIVITDANGRVVRFLEKPSWGEAFSDTINAGIYFLEPAALELIPKHTNFDFSQDLFPLMLNRSMALKGMIMDGYWKDVGNVNEYSRVHVDFYDDTLSLDTKLTKENVAEGVIFRGRNVLIDDSVRCSGKVVLADDVVVEAGCRLHNCIVGERSRIGSGGDLKNSTIWSDAVIGANSAMINAIVCNGATLGNDVQLLDNVIISDDCDLGSSVTVKANCKIWPSKTVDAGATVSTSMVWGSKWNRELFTDSKLTGLALTELSPEMCVTMGAAFGAFLGKGSTVIVSRDGSDTSRLLKRSLVSGLLAAGVNVSDLETMPVPVVRYTLLNGKNAAGIYVRHNPDDFRLIDCIFFDGNGRDLPTVKLRKVERMYLGEDFERASIDDIGHLDTPQHVLENYRSDFLAQIDAEAIRKAGFKVVIDHSNGSSCQIFPTLFSELGISAVELNASLNPRRFSPSAEENARATVQMSTIVKSLNADIGFLLNPAAEKLTVVDETGQPMDSQLLLLVMTDLYLRTHKVKKIAVPVSGSMGVEQIASEHDVEVLRVANDHLSMMEAINMPDVDFVGGTRGGFIFPGFQAGSDAMLAAVKLLEMLATTRDDLSALRGRYEHLYRQSTSVPCPWNKKGRVMRMLITGTEEKRRQLIDGVRVLEDDGWVLIYPDRHTAAFTILAESDSSSTTASLINRYRSIVVDSQS